MIFTQAIISKAITTSPEESMMVLISTELSRTGSHKQTASEGLSDNYPSEPEQPGRQALVGTVLFS